jgi:hypothetical protein
MGHALGYPELASFGKFGTAPIAALRG